jgi:glucokinase
MAQRVVGVEIADSGTRMVVALEAERATRRWYTRLAAPPSAPEAVEHVHTLIARALADSGTPSADDGAGVAIGVALAGQVDAARGVVRDVRLAAGWTDYPLASVLAERWGGPVVVRTTTQAAALAEAQVGAGRGRGDLLYLVLGRSISAGFVLGGTVYCGPRGRAGDLAHWLVRPGGPRCSCGAQGHLEPIASAQSLVRRMIGRAVDHEDSNAAMLRISGGRAEAMTAEQVVHLAVEGDPVARAVVDEALDALAPALANLVAVLDLEAIVLGGPLALAGEGFLEPLGARLAAFRPPVAPAPLLLAGELEPGAALIGALLSAGATRGHPDD